MSGPAAAAAAIAARAPGFAPRAGLVLGSGLDGVAAAIAARAKLSYRDIPGFPAPSVSGHAGEAVLGLFAGIPIVCLKGRAHYYEGAPASQVSTPIRTLRLLGCEILVLTNAAGALRADFAPGSLMLIADHINLMGTNPLVGPNEDAFGPRFPALDDAYDAALRAQMRRAAARTGVALAEGVYLACLGPNFETAAEVRAFARLGADAVGMSTAPETIIARHCGLRVVGVSVITNLATGLGGQTHSHAETLAAAERAADDLTRLIGAFLEGVGDAGR
jgi:xanthosine phosphorylase